ncbi:uncharacterized protein Z520_11226 [Fonsecaea multimorphosa CBS 102226]|uniref:NTF2-like domain-containing protein n=1 Tax=Fonsecaea multimorphosa CBS 102226 TaxID=1442371 RepID=A0A0D2K9B2_9EURO|nr:uncharacterized protein Z520_11226 [Fonsecaea multimorphosa CBS 102226]KIX92953.1 hypothetical protein Z520_11226 [Fonsecaea multimorphosa CBS 102226]OAL19179.1 hypothetical protein AYO22_09940 [Fonsecaea multimorphosa]
MKFFSTIIAVSALAGVTLASPQPFGFGRPPPPPPPPAHTNTVESKSSDSTSPSSSADPSRGASSPAGSPVATTTSSGPYKPAGAATTSTTTYLPTVAATTTTSSAASGTVSCLSSAAASSVVNGFGSLLTAYTNATANSLLASDFTDTSDSINVLAGYPLGSTTFPSKLAFELGQGSEPAIGFSVLGIDAVTCNVIAFRWEAILGSSSPVKGIDILYTENPTGTEDGWQIQTIYSEFNSCTWSVEIGGTCVPPSQARRH